MSSSELSYIQIGALDRSSNVIRAEWWRTVNSVGRFMILLRNVNGVYNGVFDVHDYVVIDITPPGGVATTMLEGRVDGPAVTLIAQDLESTWEEYVLIKGVDMMQDMLFHNDYEASYPDTTTQIRDVLGDIFSFPRAIDTNIIYTTPVLPTPIIGAIEFREGTSFISTIQEALRRAEWNSYVQDDRRLMAGIPGFSPTWVTLTNTGVNRNIIDVVEFRERDGDKLYNYIKLTGKNPMFDGVTENNAVSEWSAIPIGNIEDSTTHVMVGTYSNRVYNTNPVGSILHHILEATNIDYTSFDFSKGEIGVWARYDNQAGGAGAPGAGTAGASLNLGCRLIDNMGVTADYYGASSLLYRGDWGYCTFPLGQTYRSGSPPVINEWTVPLAGANFNWDNVERMHFMLPRPTLGGNFPSNLYIDGISLPIPVIAIEEDAASQLAYRRRPLPLPMPYISHYHTMKGKAQQLLAHHKDSGVDYLKLVVQGNVSLHYAAQSVTVNIPNLNINNEIFYMTEIHHICEPRTDVSGGFGFDYITEVELAPIGGVAYDMTRLSERQPYSATQLSMSSGVGLGVK